MALLSCKTRFKANHECTHAQVTAGGLTGRQLLTNHRFRDVGRIVLQSNSPFSSAAQPSLRSSAACEGNKTVQSPTKSVLGQASHSALEIDPCRAIDSLPPDPWPTSRQEQTNHKCTHARVTAGGNLLVRRTLNLRRGKPHPSGASNFGRRAQPHMGFRLRQKDARPSEGACLIRRVPRLRRETRAITGCSNSKVTCRRRDMGRVAVRSDSPFLCVPEPVLPSCLFRRREVPVKSPTPSAIEQVSHSQTFSPAL